MAYQRPYDAQDRYGSRLDPPAAPFASQSPSPALSRHDSVYSQSSLAPSDSISVVGAGKQPPVHQFAGSGGQEGGGGDAWKYEDPYADPYADQRRDPFSSFSTATRERDGEGTIRTTGGATEEGGAADSGTVVTGGHEDYHNPSYRNYHDPEAFGSSASQLNLPLVHDDNHPAALSRGPFDPLEDLHDPSRRRSDDDDASTVVGSTYPASKLASRQTSGDDRHLSNMPYSSLPHQDAPHDHFESEPKYPPPSSPPDREALGGGGMTADDWRDLENRRPPVWKRLFYDTTELEDKIALHRRGVGVQERPWMCWILAVGMGAGLLAEIIRNWQEQGRPIATSPTFNPMIGPSSYILINTGARFTPCVKNVPDISSLQFPCLNVTSSTATCTQTLEQLCGFGGFSGGTPDQTFRFILPVFLHAGLVHLLLNLFVLLTSSAIVERQMGSLRFIAVFVPAGVFGFILGGNFSLVGQPSVGASGAIFGTHAAVLVDLIAHWGIEYRPGRKLLFLLIEIIVGLALGLIPGVDNFAHIGGFSMGLLLSLFLLPMLHRSKRHRFIFLFLRVGALVGAIVMFVVLYKNFFTADPGAGCSWCRYLSCWPTDSNNHCKGTGLTTTTTTTTGSGSTSGSLPLLILTLGTPIWHYLTSRAR